MSDDLDAMLESIDPLDPSAWAVLGDWLLERGVPTEPKRLPSIAGVRAAVRWRLGFVTTAALEFEPDARPGLYDLQPLLRSRTLRLASELRVGARVENQTMRFGAQGASRVGPTGPTGLTARQLEAVLASAPSALHALVVWQNTAPTDPAILLPLTRQRPLSARRLELRAHAQVLLQLVDRIAGMRWHTLTLRSTWSPDDLAALEAVVANHPDVQFELVGVGPERTGNLRWVPEGAGLTVSLEGQSWALTPDSPLPPALTSALCQLGVVLLRRLGSYELARDPSLTDDAVVDVDGAPLSAPRVLEPGIELHVRVADPGRYVAPFGRPGGVMIFGMSSPPRNRTGRVVFTP